MSASKRIAVLFPGIGYTCDKPLLYYSSKYLKAQGYDVIPVPYKNFPKNVKGNHEKMEKAFLTALKQSEEILSEVDFKKYDEVLLVSKSIGTVVAETFARKHDLDVRSILFTPLKETFEVKKHASSGQKSKRKEEFWSNRIAFHGTSDPWADTNEIIKLCTRLNIPLHLYENCNHSLECGDVEKDISTLRDVMNKAILFIG